MAELHSIVGLFHEDFPGISPWGGHFIKNYEGGIVGQLIDVWGPSKLEGVLENESLEFRKQYKECNREQIFDYKFSLVDGIWQGEFSSPNGYIGGAICKTYLCLGNLDFKVVDIRNPEEYAKAIIDSMVQTGYLETFENSE